MAKVRTQFGKFCRLFGKFSFVVNGQIWKNNLAIRSNCFHNTMTNIAQNLTINGLSKDWYLNPEPQYGRRSRIHWAMGPPTEPQVAEKRFYTILVPGSAAGEIQQKGVIHHPSWDLQPSMASRMGFAKRHTQMTSSRTTRSAPRLITVTLARGTAVVSYLHRTLSYFVRGSMTVQLTSCLTGLDMAEQGNQLMIKHKQFIGLWATFYSLWQQLICLNLPHS